MKKALRCTFFLLAMVQALVSFAQAPTYIYYVPLPEQQIYNAFKVLYTSTGTNIRTVVSVVPSTSNTLIYYDHWEDGYEANLGVKTQASTEIWGDGNAGNGFPPGYPADPPIVAGSPINCQNDISLPRGSTPIKYDGRDKFGSSKSLAVSRSSWATTPGSVLADATEFYNTKSFGTFFYFPIGTNTPSDNSFSLVSVCIMASQNATTVNVDQNADGISDITAIINEGESYQVNSGNLQGGSVTSNKPVQVVMITGRIGGTYSSRWYNLLPFYMWDKSYYTPVATVNTNARSDVFIFNPHSSALTVEYQSNAGSGSWSIPAKGVQRYFMPLNSGAHFHATQPFYAVGGTDMDPAGNLTWDWGYTLIPELFLTNSIICGWGPGADRGAIPTNPIPNNGNPVWVGSTEDLVSTTIYIDMDGNPLTGALTDLNGDKYDESRVLPPYGMTRIYDNVNNDNNQTGVRVYTLDGKNIVAAWGEDASTAAAGNPFLDVGTTIPPDPDFVIRKKYNFITDGGNNGKADVGDVIQFKLMINNYTLQPYTDVYVLDSLPAQVSYVPNSTFYDLIPLADYGSGDPFPLRKPTGYYISMLPAGAKDSIYFNVTVTAVNSPFIFNNAWAYDNFGTTYRTNVKVPANFNPTSCSAFNFKDAVGATVTTYNENATIRLTITDGDQNTNALAIDSVLVIVTASNGDDEKLYLLETGISTGVFGYASRTLVSSKSTGSGDNNGILYAPAGTSITASYTDPAVITDICNAGPVTVVGPSFRKPLYFSDSTTVAAPFATRLDRIKPYDGTAATTSLLDGSSGTPTVLTQSTTITDAYELKSNQNWGQTFNLSGTGSYTVGAIEVYLDKDGGGNADITLYLRTSWAGADLATITIANATIALAGGWVSWDLSPDLSLNYGTTYYIRATASNNGGKVYWQGSSSDVYSNGTQIKHDGTTDTKDMAFRLYNPGSPSNPTVTFTQIPSMCSNLNLPSGGAVKVKLWLTNHTNMGGTGTKTNISAVLKNNGTTFLTLTSSTFTDNDGTAFTNDTLVFTGTLSGAQTILTGNAVSIDITITSGTSTFRIEYDATAKASMLRLPVTNVIDITSLAVYDTPYSGGSPITTAYNGATVYVRSTVTDPFGVYDIPTDSLFITDPALGLTKVLMTKVNDDVINCTRTFEYAWTTGVTQGLYTLRSIATEGYENEVKDTAQTTFTLQFLDTGTPCSIDFTESTYTTAVTQYAANGTIYVRVQDLDQNTNVGTQQSFNVTITSSSGDVETFTVTETQNNSGIFVGNLASTTSGTAPGGVANNNGTLYAPNGATLQLSYTDPDTPSDICTDNAFIFTAAPALTAQKTRVLPVGLYARIGDTVRWQITVTNPGNIALTDIAMTDTYNASCLTYLPAFTSPSPSSTGSGTLTWNTTAMGGTLAVGETRIFTVTFLAADDCGLIDNSVTATSTLNGLSSTATSPVNLVDPKLTITKTRTSPYVVYVGSPVTYQIVVTNTGNTTASTVPLADYYSAYNLSFVSADTPPDAFGGGQLNWDNIGPILPAASVTINLNFTALNGNEGDFVLNNASVEYAYDQYGNTIPSVNDSARVLVINPPVAIDDYDTTLINTPVTGNALVNDYDNDGDVITVTPQVNQTAGGIGGTYSIDQYGVYTYIPPLDATGDATFTYQICDPSGACDTAVVHIHVVSCYDPPSRPGNVH
ncbi:MAG: Ig-like domain-containing protein [Bacteroidales bacterium]